MLTLPIVTFVFIYKIIDSGLASDDFENLRHPYESLLSYDDSNGVLSASSSRSLSHSEMTHFNPNPISMVNVSPFQITWKRKEDMVKLRRAIRQEARKHAERYDKTHNFNKTRDQFIQLESNENRDKKRESTNQLSMGLDIGETGQSSSEKKFKLSSSTEKSSLHGPAEISKISRSSSNSAKI